MADHLDRQGLAPARSARIYEGWIARTHDQSHPLVYSTGDEYRDREELDRILEQAKRLSLPVTLQHPPGLISQDAKPDNYIGKVFDAWMDERDGVPHVVVRFVVDQFEPMAGENQQAIDAGIIELSLGYSATLDDAGFQRNIRLNHLSVVPGGRCGTCELNPNRLDCEADYRRETGGFATIVPGATTVENMASVTEIKIDAESLKAAFESLGFAKQDSAHEHKTDCACTNRASALNTGDVMDAAELQKKLDEALAALEANKTQIAALEASLTSAQADVEKAQMDATLAAEKAEASLTVANGQVAKLTEDLKAKADEVEAAKTARTDAESTEFNARVDARVELLSKADAVGIEDARAKSDVEIKLAVIKTVRGKDVKADAKPDFIDGMFVIAMEQFEAAQASNAAVREAVENHKDEAETNSSHDPIKAEAEIAAANQQARKDRWRH